jgi:hypothetical protein
MKWFKLKIKRLFIIFIAIIIWSIFSLNSVLSDNTFFPSKDIILKVIKTYGGEGNLREQENKNNYTIRASLYSPRGEFFGIYLYYFKKPNKIREEFYLLLYNLFVAKIYNAGEVYITQNGEKVEDEIRIAQFKKSADLRSKMGFFSLLYLLDHQDKVNYLGEELINGKNCLGLEVIIDKDVKCVYFFDSETFLLSKFIRAISSPKGSVKTTVYCYDFEKVDRITLPFRMEIYQDGRKVSERIVREISFAELDDDLFVIKDNGN